MDIMQTRIILRIILTYKKHKKQESQCEGKGNF